MSVEGIPAPGPRGDTVLGSVLEFKHDPLQFALWASRAYGDVVRFRMGVGDWYLVTHPELIWEMMTGQADVFLKPKVAHRLWRDFLGHGLLTAEGDEWKRQHGLMRPALHGDRLTHYGDVMVSYADRMIDGWQEGSERDVHRDFTALTLEIVAKCLFDADVRSGGETARVGDAMEVLQQVMVEHIHMPVPVPRWWPTERNRRKVDAIDTIRGIVGAIIAERRRTGVDRGDLLSMLVQTRFEDGDALSDKEIHDQACTLFFAGHETSANALTWCWYLLARHPEVVATLRAELDRVLGDRPATMGDLRRLPYLDQVVKESMRILPPVWVFMKEPTRDTLLGGFRIPKGVQVMISPYVTHHDARFWPEPDCFRPERFAKDRLESIPRGAYIPFSGGSRVCFGKSFAQAELRLIVATMIRRLDAVVPATYLPVKKAELSMHPRDGMPIVVAARARRGTEEHAA